MSNEIRTKITEILSHAGVRFSAIYMGEKKNALGGTGTMDRWAYTFTQTENVPHSIEFEFYTGLGDRKQPAWNPLEPGMSGIYDGGPAPRPGTLLHAEWKRQAKPQAPHPADLLYSLISDAEACDMSFGTWCNEFGCDTDSRKALETYEAYQRNGDKLRRFFARGTLEALTNALQDY